MHSDQSSAAARVFVAQEQRRLDFADAETWGEVIFLTADEYKPQRNSLMNLQILDHVRTTLQRSYRPDTDWLVLTGNPIMIGWVMHIALTKAQEQKANVGVLHYDRVRNGYREAIVPTN